MKKIIYLTAALIAVVLVAGCKKVAPVVATTDVYIAGIDAGQAVYWKNGVEKVLAHSGGAYGITVAGSDVYVGGVVFTGNTNHAAFWKNGAQTILWDSSTSTAYQPVIAGGDVYVPGYVFGVPPLVSPVYWKNGQKVVVAPTQMGFAMGMAVSGSDIYVMGTSFNGAADTALVWKNGVRIAGMQSIDAGEYSQLFFSGQTGYVVGNGGYYVNFNQFVPLQAASPDDSVRTYGMCLSGDTIYVAGGIVDGTGVQRPVYWKNGAMVQLPNYSDSSAGTYGMAVTGSDVYVIGDTFVNGRIAGVYWKNGVEETLTTNGNAYAIATSAP